MRKSHEWIAAFGERLDEAIYTCSARATASCELQARGVICGGSSADWTNAAAAWHLESRSEPKEQPRPGSRSPLRVSSRRPLPPVVPGLHHVLRDILLANHGQTVLVRDPPPAHVRRSSPAAASADHPDPSLPSGRGRHWHWPLQLGEDLAEVIRIAAQEPPRDGFAFTGDGVGGRDCAAAGRLFAIWVAPSRPTGSNTPFAVTGIGGQHRGGSIRSSETPGKQGSTAAHYPVETPDGVLPRRYRDFLVRWGNAWRAIAKAPGYSTRAAPGRADKPDLPWVYNGAQCLAAVVQASAHPQLGSLLSAYKQVASGSPLSRESSRFDATVNPAGYGGMQATHASTGYGGITDAIMSSSSSLHDREHASWVRCVDIARVCILWLCGGVYVDTDAEPGPDADRMPRWLIEPMDACTEEPSVARGHSVDSELPDAQVERGTCLSSTPERRGCQASRSFDQLHPVAVLPTDPEGVVHNCWMAAGTPGLPIFGAILRSTSWTAAAEGSPMEATGPVLLSAVMNMVHSYFIELPLILPTRSGYPADDAARAGVIPEGAGSQSIEGVESDSLSPVHSYMVAYSLGIGGYSIPRVFSESLESHNDGTLRLLQPAVTAMLHNVWQRCEQVVSSRQRLITELKLGYLGPRNSISEPFLSLLAISGGREGGVSGIPERERLQTGPMSEPVGPRGHAPADNGKLPFGHTVFVLPGQCIFGNHWRETQPFDAREDPSNSIKRHAAAPSDSVQSQARGGSGTASVASIALHQWDQTWVTRGGDGSFDGAYAAVDQLAAALDAALSVNSAAPRIRSAALAPGGSTGSVATSSSERLHLALLGVSQPSCDLVEEHELAVSDAITRLVSKSKPKRLGPGQHRRHTLHDAADSDRAAVALPSIAPFSPPVHRSPTLSPKRSDLPVTDRDLATAGWPAKSGGVESGENTDSEGPRPVQDSNSPFNGHQDMALQPFSDQEVAWDSDASFGVQNAVLEAIGKSAKSRTSRAHRRWAVRNLLRKHDLKHVEAESRPKAADADSAVLSLASRIQQMAKAQALSYGSYDWGVIGIPRGSRHGYKSHRPLRTRTRSSTAIPLSQLGRLGQSVPVKPSSADCLLQTKSGTATRKGKNEGVSESPRTVASSSLATSNRALSAHTRRSQGARLLPMSSAKPVGTTVASATSAGAPEETKSSSVVAVPMVPGLRPRKSPGRGTPLRGVGRTATGRAVHGSMVRSSPRVSHSQAAVLSASIAMDNDSDDRGGAVADSQHASRGDHYMHEVIDSMRDEPYRRGVSVNVPSGMMETMRGRLEEVKKSPPTDGSVLAWNRSKRMLAAIDSAVDRHSEWVHFESIEDADAMCRLLGLREHGEIPEPPQERQQPRSEDERNHYIDSVLAAVTGVGWTGRDSRSAPGIGRDVGAAGYGGALGLVYDGYGGTINVGVDTSDVAALHKAVSSVQSPQSGAIAAFAGQSDGFLPGFEAIQQQGSEIMHQEIPAADNESRPTGTPEMLAAERPPRDMTRLQQAARERIEQSEHVGRGAVGALLRQAARALLAMHKAGTTGSPAAARLAVSSARVLQVLSNSGAPMAVRVRVLLQKLRARALVGDYGDR